MKQQKTGHILNLSSVAEHKVHADGAVYAATKHAVLALSEGAAPGSEALQHPHHGDLARRGGHGTDE
jgi:NAD(P)-dependent dehydrogenase (short-subunit alcohol dehydrogenase family)